MTQNNRPEDLLDWLGLKSRPDWRVAKPLGRLSGFIVSVAIVLIPLLVLGALLAAGSVLFDTIRNVVIPPENGSSSPNLGAGALIAALLSAPFVIWGTAIKFQSLGFQREGHITDRIAKAVEQLGAEKTVKRAGKEETEPNIEVRIGGLLSIERIAQDSVTYGKGRDHVRMMEILCAYVRNNAPASGAADGCPELGEDADLKEIQSIGQKIYIWVEGLPKPREDIQLALTILGRRSDRQRLYEARWGKAATDAKWVFGQPCPTLPVGDALDAAALKLFQTELGTWRQDINSFKGYRPDLRETNLQRADLSDLNFSGTKLEGARLQGADLWAAQMQGSRLRHAQLQGATLWSTQLQLAGLHHAQLQGAHLDSAGLQGASLGGAQLQGVGLVWAQLQGANLGGVALQGADFSEANLLGAQLRRADLTNVQLQGANLKEANLTDGALQSLTIPRGLLTPEQLASAFGDGSVRLPEDLPRPAHWSVTELKPWDFTTERDKWRASPETYVPPT